MEALPAYTDVSIIRVNCLKLKEALLPSPTSRLAEMQQELPKLASDLFQAYMEEVQNALTHLQAPTSAVEDYVDKIEFLAQVRLGSGIRNISVIQGVGFRSFGCEHVKIHLRWSA